MLNRQRTLLYLLDLAGGETTPLHLVKWALLLREESGSKGGLRSTNSFPTNFGHIRFVSLRK